MPSRLEPKGDKPLQAFVEVDSSVEGLVCGQPAPVVVTGERLRGTLFVEGVGDFSMATMFHRVDLYEGAGDNRALVCSKHSRVITPVPGGAYSMPKDSRFPFDLDLQWSTPSFEGEHLAIVHVLEVHLVEVNYEIGGNRAILTEQMIGVQAPVARQAEDRAFISVAACGGSLRLQLSGGDVLPLGGTSVARVAAHSLTEPLARVYVELLVTEGSAPPRCLREFEVWSAANGDSAEAFLSEGVALPLRLSDGACGAEEQEGGLLWPTTPIAGQPPPLPPFGPVTHCLRLCVVPAAEGDKEAGTLPVMLTPVGGAVGAPRGTLKARVRSAPLQQRRGSCGSRALQLFFLGTTTILAVLIACWLPPNDVYLRGWGTWPTQWQLSGRGLPDPLLTLAAREVREKDAPESPGWRAKDADEF